MSKKKHKQKKISEKQKKILRKVLNIQNDAIGNALEGVNAAAKDLYAMNMLAEIILEEKII